MDNQFKLSEKTVVIHGPVSPIVQSLANQLTELGADVALVTDDEKVAQVYCANLMDLREVHRSRGRAAGFFSARSSLKACNDLFARASEAFGSIDVYIDANAIPVFLDPQRPEAFEELIKKQSQMFNETLLMSAVAQKYLHNRVKGRIIFIAFEAAARGFSQNAMNCLFRSSLKDYAKNLAIDFADKQVTANVIVCGVTEDYLLKRSPGKSISESRAKLSESLKDHRLVEPTEIANLVGFVSSALSSSLTGQVLYATHGV